MTAEVLISGQGGLSAPQLPDIPGIESFEGTTFHSARWNHDHDLTGERVAVIGTGASAIQFVPEIQPKAGKLHVFQRTAPWVMPHRARRLSQRERRLFRRVPAAQRAMRAAIYWGREALVVLFRHPRFGKRVERVALRHLHSQVKDPELRRKLKPNFAIGCKRILPSNEWYPALTQPNVEVVTDGIREVRPHSIVTADGSEREVDTIVFGTGFHVTDIPIAGMIRGRDGRTLEQVWNGSPEAYLGSTVAGYPNLFLLVGPNTALGPQLDRVHDRVADQPRVGRPQHDAPARRPRGRGAPGGPALVQRGAEPDDGGHRVGHRRLLELLHRPQRPQLHALADVHLAVPAAHARLRRVLAYSLDNDPRPTKAPQKRARPRRSCGASPRPRSFANLTGRVRAFYLSPRLTGVQDPQRGS